MLKFSDFSFAYKSQKKPTLKKIDLHIQQGEKVLIVGPSGSGKTTIGSCLNGLIPFSYQGQISGSLQIAGKETQQTDIHAISQIVGTVLQDTDGQFVGLSVGEDIAFALENNCIPQTEMKDLVRKAAAMVEMDSFLSHAPFALSGGQKQRVSLSGIIVDDVEVFLLDEPLANLDPKTGRVAIELIDDIHRETGKTTVIIEHRLEEVLHRNVDRIVLLERGEIVCDLPPHVLLAKDTLWQKGIREPLYLSALKHAGCELREEDKVAYFDTLQLDRHKERLLEWFHAGDHAPKRVLGDPLLSLENVSYSYSGNDQVLKELSFVIKKGEMVSILGNNGAGKSTLAKIVMGVIRPDTGRVCYKNKDVTHTSISDRSRFVGYVMQNPNHMISHHLIFDEVAFGLRLRGEKDDVVKEKVMTVLKLCGLSKYRTWPIAALSYGQKKRVTIASILVMEPELLLLDEPTAGQDHHHYTEIMEFLHTLNQTMGITIVLITHDMHLALEYTDRAIVLSDGTLLCDDTVAKVFSDEDVIHQANLKLTSLYELAKKVGISAVDDFITCFINQEKANRATERLEQ